MWIKDLPRLMRNQIVETHRLFLCDRCLNHFTTKPSFQKHIQMCCEINKARLEVTDEFHNIMKFKNFKYQEKVPFVIYGDIESILEKMDGERYGLNTEYTHKHIPFSVAYYLKCSYDDSLSEFKTYRGADCMEWFTEQLKNIATRIDGIIRNTVPIKLLVQEKLQYLTAKKCHICGDTFKDEDVKVVDHCHQFEI